MGDLLNRLSRPVAVGAAIVAAVSIAIAAPHIVPFTSLSTLSYDWQDADLFLWNFWWTKHALESGQQPYWTNLLMYPAGSSLAFHSYPLPYSLLTVPLQALIGGVQGLVVSFNAVVLFSTVASGLGAYFLALRVTNHVPAAVIAGIVFVCAPYRALNISRIHVLATEVIAWYVWAWIGFASTPTWAGAVLVGGCLAVALYTSPEYAMHAVAFSGLWTMWKVVGGTRLGVDWWRRIWIAVLVAIALAAPLLLVQARSVTRVEVSPVRALDEAASWSPALASIVTPSRVQPVYGRLFASAGEYGTRGLVGMRSETCIALTVWGLVIVAALRVRRDGTQFWFAAAAGFLILLLGPYLRLTGTVDTPVPLPYAVAYWLFPPLQIARDPTRFFAIALLMISVISAFGARALIVGLKDRVAPILAAGAIGTLVVFEGLTVRPGKMPASNLISPAYDVVAAAAGEFAVLDLSQDQAALLAQTRHGRPITAGGVSNPRAAPVSTALDIERDFRNAAGTLALEPSALALRLESDREELERFGLRFVVFPLGDSNQMELAKRLGLRMTTIGDRVIGERF